MAKGATLVEVIYNDSEEHVPVLVGIGDTIVATDWAEEEYPFPSKPVLRGLEPAEAEFEKELFRDAVARIDVKREDRSGLYACYLGALRGKLRGSELGWVEWLQMVTIPQDEEAGEPDEDREPGESDGPSSVS